MKNKIKHYIVKFRQLLYDSNEVIKDLITVIFGLFGIGIGLLVYSPFFILYWFLMITSDLLYGSLNGFRRVRK